ncbi:cationic amino acid transporter 4 [Bombyx mandarina]|uniref:Cationic amino acid transporter C-terminal domain-containing protein n=2 Tax=Bombyx TaxID=7090 RepID=A0A8R2AL91_BOMMO|nr:cationic amino acid transporter 4 [Bombyx mori]XP_028042825.1 cationic amino acid transporter 4 [Bombyx mandarina]XP_028042826.1 cationic amino acid transporter 4 [Bombyx mandarina]XP_037868428.1 cationic amino acid transporter 4 [Bombyx mori]
MPGARHKILGHVLSGFCHKMNRCKPLHGDSMDTPLNRCLTTFDITLLGVGHMVGAGIYVLTGTVAKSMAGPSTALSFLLAGITSTLAALCYAEFGTRIPRAGSAYAYTYVSIGEFWAFIIGWNIVLEYMIGAASVARAWSGYLDSILHGAISNATVALTGELHETLLSRYPDILAFLICLAASLILAAGVKTSAYINNGLTILNLLVISLVIFLGFYYADISNWSEKNGGFMPFGFSGVLAGAATCFYAFVGFDSISASSEEAKDPSRSIPVATVLSMAVVAFGYILVAMALTLMVPYNTINPDAALPAALGAVHADWAKYAVAVGAVCGMTTTLLGSMFSLPRCLYAMSADGLLFGFFSDISNKAQIPVANLAISGLSSAFIALLFDLEKLVEFMSIGTLLAYTIVSAAVIILRYRPTPTTEDKGFVVPQLDSPCDREDSSATGTPATDGGSSSSEMFETLTVGRLRPQFAWLEPLVGGRAPGAAVTCSVYTFTIATAALCAHNHFLVEPAGLWVLLPDFVLIFIIISCLVIIWAHQQSPTRLPFRVPWVPLLPAASVMLNVELMINLNALTWARFAMWMTFGLLVYFLYGIHHSKLGEGVAGLLSSGGNNSDWGAVEKTSSRRIGRFGRSSKGDDRKPIICEDELSRREP